MCATKHNICLYINYLSINASFSTSYTTNMRLNGYSVPSQWRLCPGAQTCSYDTPVVPQIDKTSMERTYSFSSSFNVQNRFSSRFWNYPSPQFSEALEPLFCCDAFLGPVCTQLISLYGNFCDFIVIPYLMIEKWGQGVTRYFAGQNKKLVVAFLNGVFHSPWDSQSILSIREIATSSWTTPCASSWNLKNWIAMMYSSLSACTAYYSCNSLQTQWNNNQTGLTHAQNDKSYLLYLIQSGIPVDLTDTQKYFFRDFDKTVNYNQVGLLLLLSGLFRPLPLSMVLYTDPNTNCFNTIACYISGLLNSIQPRQPPQLIHENATDGVVAYLLIANASAYTATISNVLCVMNLGNTYFPEYTITGSPSVAAVSSLKQTYVGGTVNDNFVNSFSIQQQTTPATFTLNLTLLAQNTHIFQIY